MSYDYAGYQKTKTKNEAEYVKLTLSQGFFFYSFYHLRHNCKSTKPVLIPISIGLCGYCFGIPIVSGLDFDLHH